MDQRVLCLTFIFLIAGVNLVLALLVGVLGSGQRGSRMFMLFLLSLSEWTLAFGIQLALPAASVWKIRFANLQYLGAAAGPVLFLLYLLIYSGRTRLLAGNVRYLLLVEPLLFNVLVWSDPFHHLFRRSLQVVYRAGFEVNLPDFGSLLWVHVTYAYALMFLAAFLLVRLALSGRARRRPQVILLLLAAFAPWLASLIDLLEINPTLVDNTHIGFLITGGCLFLNTIRYRLFLIRPEQMARAILDSMSDMVLILDGSGWIEQANPTLFGTLGFNQTELRYGHISRFLLRPEWKDLEAASPEGGPYHLASTSVEASFSTRNRQELPVQLTVTPFRGKESALDGYLLVARDVSVQRQLEEERRRGDRLEAVQGLAGGVAHDFNNILAAAALHVEHLAGKLLAEHRLRPHVQALSVSIRRAADQAERLLLFSGHHPFEPRPVDLNVFLSEAAEALSKGLENPRAVQLELAEEPLPVSIDPELLRRALGILLARIAKEMGDRMAVKITSSLLPASTDPRQPQAGPRACIILRGGSKEWIEGRGRDLFEPYLRSESTISTDLELSVIDGVISQHQGNLLLRMGEEGAPELQLLLPLRQGQA